MLKLNLKRITCAALSAVVLAAPMLATTTASAGVSLNDPAILQIKAAMIQAMQQGTQAQAAQQAQQDQAARSSQDCTDIANEAKNSANAVVTRNQPPDPTKVVQNTTCFVDIATVQIPVIMTGMSFIDSIINSQVQKFLTGACNKAQSFLGDLQSQAMAQLNNATGGAAGLVMGYAQNGTGNLSDLQNIGMGAAQNAINSTLNSVANTANNAISNAWNSQFNNIQTNWQQQSAQMMCGLGIADATYCPNCMDNPTHPSCIGPRPYCGYGTGANLSPPLCQDPYWNQGGG